MRILERLSDEDLRNLGHYLGLVVAGLGLALAIHATERDFLSAGDAWDFVGTFLPFAILGSLVFFAGMGLKQEDERPVTAALVISALVLIAAFALAFKASETQILEGTGETGFWGFLTYFLITTSTFAVLLVVSHVAGHLGRPVAVLGLASAAVILCAGLAMTVHDAQGPSSVPEGWDILGQLTEYAGLALLLCVASLRIFDVRPEPTLVWLSATIVALGGLGYAIALANRVPSDGEWFILTALSRDVLLAVLILVFAGVLGARQAGPASMVVIVFTIFAGIYGVATFNVQPSERFWFVLAYTLPMVARGLLALLVAEVWERRDSEPEPSFGAAEPEQSPGLSAV